MKTNLMLALAYWRPLLHLVLLSAKWWVQSLFVRKEK